MAIVRTVDDLIRRFRSDVDDPLRGPTSAPDNDSLWSVSDVSDYMTEAAAKVGRVGQQLFRTMTFPIVANEAFIKLPQGMSAIFDIRRAYLQGIRREVEPANIDGLLRHHRDYGFLNGTESWETWCGVPRFIIRDYVPGMLRLAPIPEASDVLEITAMFVPLMDDGMPLPFDDLEDIALMLLWMKKMAYSKHDADTYDKTLADKYEGEFERRSLARQAEARRVRRAVQPVRFSW